MALLAKKNLKLETRGGTMVVAEYDTNPPIDGAFIETADMRKSYVGRVAFKTQGPRITYNCHGMTFGSSRAWIPDEEVRKILADDKYQKISGVSEVLPGDVIIYVSEDGDPEHSGIVLENIEKDPRIPKIISKWGRGEEIIHWANDSEYDFQNAEYWRMSC